MRTSTRFRMDTYAVTYPNRYRQSRTVHKYQRNANSTRCNLHPHAEITFDRPQGPVFVFCRRCFTDRERESLMTDTDLTGPRTGQILSRAQAALAEYAPLLDAIPDVEDDDDAMIRILEQIAAAEDVGALDDAWEGNGLAKYVDQPLLITQIQKSPAKFDGGLSHFLILRCKTKGGEIVTTTTSSTACVAQLIKARALGAEEILAIPRSATTRKGFTVMHLEFPVG